MNTFFGMIKQISFTRKFLRFCMFRMLVYKLSQETYEMQYFEVFFNFTFN